MRTLVFGYGNLDRQDDGVAWHVIKALRTILNYDFPEQIDDDFDSTADLVFIFQLQLTPEIAENLNDFDRVCFVDAHTGAAREDVHVEIINPIFNNSPLTHHLTPQSLLSIIDTLYNEVPESILISIHGFEFEFSQDLSIKTNDLVPLAVESILAWLDQSQEL